MRGLPVRQVKATCSPTALAVAVSREGQRSGWTVGTKEIRKGGVGGWEELGAQLGGGVEVFVCVCVCVCGMGKGC